MGLADNLRTSRLRCELLLDLNEKGVYPCGRRELNPIREKVEVPGSHSRDGIRNP